MMIIVCNRCGAYEPEDSQFCGGCRAFLEFDGTLVEGRWVDGRLAEAAGTGQPAGPPAPSLRADQPAPSRRPEQSAATPRPGQPATAAPAARSGQPGVAAPAPRSGQPASAVPAGEATAGHSDPPDRAEATAAQQPGETRRVVRRPRVEPVRPPTGAELPCPRCARGNDPTRVYCRFDGEPLRPAPESAEVVPPWWKRVWRRLFGRNRRRARDRRPGTPDRRFRLPTGWIVVAVLAVLAVLLNGQIRAFAGWAELAVRDRASARQPINPSKLTASSSRPGNGPDRLTDRAHDRFWAPQGPPAGSWVEFTLPKPVRLLDVIVTGGRHGEAVEFQKQGRPNEIEAVLTSADGTSVSSRLVLRDQHGPQSFTLKGERVVTVRMTFLSAYGMGPNRFMAVAEVEFFYRN